MEGVKHRGWVGAQGMRLHTNGSTAKHQADGTKAAGETGAVPATSDVPDEREVGEASTVTGSPFSWPQEAVVYRFIGPSDGSVGRRETAGTRHRGSCAAGAGAGAKVNTMALVAEKGSKAQTQARKHEHRRRSRALMPSAAQSERFSVESRSLRF